MLYLAFKCLVLHYQFKCKITLQNLKNRLWVNSDNVCGIVDALKHMQRHYSAAQNKQKGQACISRPALVLCVYFWWGDTPTSPNLLRGATAARSVTQKYTH